MARVQDRENTPESLADGDGDGDGVPIAAPPSDSATPLDERAEALPPSDHADGETVGEAELDVLRRVGRHWPPPAETSSLADTASDLNVRETKVGQQHGNQYVRIQRPRRAAFRNLEAGVLQVTEEVPRAQGLLAKSLVRLRGTLIGDPLSNAQAIHERLTKVKALAVLSSDALSSVAYATGQLNAVLILAGAAALGYSLGIAAAIAALLALVALSYRQTIKAYPRGGGSYIVSKDNLGNMAGLAAGSSLMIDYILTVAVSITAGVAALQSLGPAGSVWANLPTVPLSLALIALLLVGNLRGIRESGAIFMVPTYLFVGGMYIMIVAGAYIFFKGGAHVEPYHPAYAVHATEGLGVFLILRAFASGCTALTGVEAISDGVPAFQTIKGQKLTEWRNARTTLTVMATLAIGMFVGVTLLVQAFGLVPNPGDNYPTLLSQLAGRVFGTGAMFWYVQITTALILTLAANTAYSDFPRLLFFMARDSFVPHQFAHRGDRLSYSNGIILLTVLAAVLIAATGGNVNDLINLYVIGVFNSFTLSQASMVKRWWTHRTPGQEGYEPQWRRNIVVNGIGTVVTFGVLLITAITKFERGAWLVVVLVPILITVFWRINRHYTQTKKQLESETPLTPQKIRHTVLVPIADLNRPALQTLAYACSITERVIAVHISDSDEDRAHIKQKWEAWGNHVPLVVIDSPFRSIIQPLLAYIDAIDRQSATDTLTVVLPEFVPVHWWDHVLHNQTALRLKSALHFRPGTVVTSVPYHLRQE